MFLLDTNVVSELRRTERANPAVVHWSTRQAPTDLFISVVTVFELELGIHLIARRDPVQAEMFRAWVDGNVLPAFDGRILSIDIKIAARCAPLHVPNKRPDRDALIAATALVFGMTIVTRNTADFKGTEAALLNPWDLKA